VAASGVAQVWLPAGEIYACTDPKTANGTLVVPHLSFRGVPTTNIRMTFKAGRMTEFKADKNAKMLQEFFKLAKGDIGVLSVLDIGLNPNSRPLTGSPYASFEMEGVVTLGIGNSSWAGCDVEADSGLSMHIPEATLTIDGVPSVENGRLKID
jgi:leucyl aminopeptidase (aminopeptidase T)